MFPQTFPENAFLEPFSGHFHAFHTAFEASNEVLVKTRALLFR